MKIRDYKYKFANFYKKMHARGQLGLIFSRFVSPCSLQMGGGKTTRLPKRLEIESREQGIVPNPLPTKECEYNKCGLLTKFVQSRWLDIGLVLFLRVKMAGYWPSSFFFCMFMDSAEMESRSINTPKRERDQYPAILTKKAWSIKDFWEIFLARHSR